MSKRHDKKTLAKACRLYDKGVSLREIMKETGIKSTSTIQFQCDPEYREAHIARTKKWKKENTDRWKEINSKAVRKYQRKQNKLR